jgi:hypothetical protein
MAVLRRDEEMPAGNGRIMSAVLPPENSAGGGKRGSLAPDASPPALETVKIQIDYRSGIQGKQLAHKKPPHNGNTERAAHFRPVAEPCSQRDGAQKGRHGGHHDGTDPQ